jgi:hypothetical protein
MIYAEISFSTKKESGIVTRVLENTFSKPNLKQAYNASQLKANFALENFSFGARNVNVNILVYFVDRTTTICIENAVAITDVAILKHNVDNYFDAIRNAFKRNNIRIRNSTAYIIIRGIKIFGERKSKWQGLWSDFTTNITELVGSLAGLTIIWLLVFKQYLTIAQAEEKSIDWVIPRGLYY